MQEPSTRDLILKEAKACFARDGFDGTSLNDIAAGVGIKRPSLLHYFDSKADIYAQVLGAALADWGLRINESVKSASDSWAMVNSVLEASFDFFKANPDVVRLFRREALGAQSASTKAPGVILQPFFARAVKFLEREMDAGRFRRHDAENLIFTGYGALLSYFSDNELLSDLLGSDPFTEDAMQRRYSHIRDFFLAALEP